MTKIEKCGGTMKEFILWDNVQNLRMFRQELAHRFDLIIKRLLDLDFKLEEDFEGWIFWLIDFLSKESLNDYWDDPILSLWQLFKEVLAPFKSVKLASFLPLCSFFRDFTKNLAVQFKSLQTMFKYAVFCAHLFLQLHEEWAKTGMKKSFSQKKKRLLWWLME